MKHLFFLCYYYYYYYLLLFRKQLYIFFAKFPPKTGKCLRNERKASQVYLNLHLNINWQINFLYYPIKVEQLIFSIASPPPTTSSVQSDDDTLHSVAPTGRFHTLPKE